MTTTYALWWPGRASVPADRAWINTTRQFPRPHVTHESLEAAQKAADWFIATGAAPPVLIRQTGRRTWVSLPPEFQPVSREARAGISGPAYAVKGSASQP